MSFWIRRTPAGTYTINDLGLTVEGAGAEIDLHLAYPYEVLQDSADLAAALAISAVDRITGPSGSLVPAASAFSDSVAPHALNNTTAHTGLLAHSQLVLPTRFLTVGSQGCDYTTIKAAVTAAISGGASAAAPWGITVHPGTYAEDPMTIQPGIALSALYPNRMDTVFVTATDAANDLFTCTGGYIAGIRVSGVTDPSYALFRMATASTLTVLHGVSIRGCSTGVAVSNGASVVATNFSIQLSGSGQEVTTGVSVTGSGSYFGLVGGFFSVPSALLPLYTGNPIQTVIRNASSGRLFVSGATFTVAPKDTTADVVLADGGSTTTLLSCDIRDSGTGVHIDAGGSNTTIIVQGASFVGNYLNGKCDSSTGAVMISSSADDFKWSGVAGSVLSGTAQLQDYDTTFLIGALQYAYETGARLDLGAWFHDLTSTALTYPETPVTVNSGLDVDVPAGHGVITTHVPSHDARTVSWNATTLTLTASTTNYVVYNGATDALAVLTSPPGESAILLATAVTNGSGVRFLHQTRTFQHNEIKRLHDYLLATRKLALHSGMGVSAGSSGRKFTVGAGSYYIALDLVSYVGATDAGFSYFYGTNGATEVTGQTQVSNTQYDNAGTLTTMTSGYYRSDTVVVTSDGRVSVIYGTAEYATQALAEVALSANTPTFMEASAFPVARLIVQEAGSIVSFIDIRPQPAIGGSSGSGGVTVHSALSGLDADDHVQYLLAAGTRAMTGDLSLGSNDITNVGTVDGVDVSDHSARHDPGGADALATAAPAAILVGASATEGSATSLARSDHGHSVTTGAPSNIGTANAAGSSSSVPRLDHVHDHGTQSTGTHHAVVSTLVNGFMSSADKIILDDLASGHTILTCRNETGSTIPKGTLVASAGWSGVHACPYLVIADKDDGAKRPAIGVTYAAIADSTNGPVLISGILNGVDTSAWSVTDQLVLGNAGAFSRPPPDVDPFTGEVQNVGSVTRVDATDGQIILIPDGLEAISASQVFALVGTSGTPSKTNKYVTDSDPRNTNSRTPTAHATTHDLGGTDGLTARQLVWFLDEGPAEGFLSGAYKEITGGVFPTSVIWYDSSGVGKKKIVEKTITRNANQTPSSIAWKIYDASEVLIRTITDTFTYSSGVFESSRVRTVV
jgi:hypothetical protein